MSQAFDLMGHNLRSGYTLVEASAGTGKTYSITWLVTRLLLERGLEADDLLVVTFTIAATEELDSRIRAHLTEVLAQWPDQSSRPSKLEVVSDEATDGSSEEDATEDLAGDQLEGELGAL